MNNAQLPIARKEGLVIQEMPDEILVYDLETNKAHCLNQTAAFVWEACDGKNSVADITRLFGSHSGSPVQEDLIWLAIDQLNNKKLLEKEIAVNFHGQTRREVIKKIGLAAVIALPIVSSLIAPVAASAVTGVCADTCQCTRTGAGTCQPGVAGSTVTETCTGNCRACGVDSNGNQTGTCTADATGVCTINCVQAP